MFYDLYYTVQEIEVKLWDAARLKIRLQNAFDAADFPYCFTFLF
ncbi:hypothetical protein AAJ76_450004754 [Vairimorpha ceranae]|uniref:Uncharacterized protein n=1 Tax=Vairimorpha ceranae TaxID=40302 RepID=A0A0F9WD82_9MICR|nr:hypothetical protein AAJ76_450004754 [Vairimorpha ceranae]KKO74785.1 hypothetical protein AAJ76_450004754 [Vairimorpha ceranae]